MCANSAASRSTLSGGTLFAGLFALCGGLAAIHVASIMLSPVIHRFFHKWHIDIDEDGKAP